MDNWDKIAELLSREAVLDGALSRFEDTPAPLGALSVDKAFLDDISEWRRILAMDIDARNPGLPTHILDYAVQMTIDRILFLRIAEDRGIEPHQRLRGTLTQLRTGGFGEESKLRKNYIYSELLGLFRQSDDLYNSGLFHFSYEKGRKEAPDTITHNLQVGDDVLATIINQLYYPYPYRFDVIPIEILGQVYEQFLGKVIVRTPTKGVTIEDKPQVRKAGGVYYTPTYIVDYIVERTIGRLLEGKTPEEASELRILDPACGSGTFLIGAYDYLLRWYLNYYVTHEPSVLARKRKNKPVELDPNATGSDPRSPEAYRLTLAERKRILLANIFGVDIDTQAVEVAKLSLLLKVLERDNYEGTQFTLDLEDRERILPDLANNIKCGNSLIGLDFYEKLQSSFLSDEEERRINAFNWGSTFPEIMDRGGFDIIIGNPPYLKEYTYNQPFKDLQGTRLSKYYQGKMDLWYIFACLSLDLLKPGGLHSFIATNNWITNTGARLLRQKILSSGKLLSFIDFGDFRVFSQAGIQTMIYEIEKSRSGHSGDVAYSRVTDPKISVARVSTYLLEQRPDQSIIQFTSQVSKLSDGNPFTFVPDLQETVLSHIAEMGTYHLQDEDVAQGIVAPQDFVTAQHKNKSPNLSGQVGRGIFVLSTEELEALALQPNEVTLIKPYFTTRELQKFYGSADNKLWIIYTRSDIAARINDYPRIKSHLDRFAPVITSSYGPYGLHRARDERFFCGEKIISLRKTASPHFTYTDFPCYVSQTFNIIKPVGINLKYLTAVLNSRVAYFWFKNKGKMQGDALQLDKEPLLAFPIRVIDSTNGADLRQQEHIIQQVESIMRLYQLLGLSLLPHEKARIQARIDSTIRQIDQIVYRLYQLSPEDIAIIEDLPLLVSTLPPPGTSVSVLSKSNQIV